jgi:eukaryotic-like serine/threonine-protein kinase
VLSTEQVDRLLGPGWGAADPAAGAPGLAEACRRTGAVASLRGSLSPLAGRYVVGLEATSCATGEALITQMLSVDAKEQVLPGMRTMAAAVRNRLSASLLPPGGPHGMAIANSLPNPPAAGPSAGNRTARRERD